MIPDGEFRDEGGPLRRKRPWWFTLLLVLLILPAFSMPWVIADAPKGSLLAILIKWYPAFLLLSGLCSWFAYPQRKDVAWILVVIMILSAVSLFMI